MIPACPDPFLAVSPKAVGGIILYFYLSKVALDALASRMPDTVQGWLNPLR